jgi:phosphoribosylaminoimidazole-succinocarboxamide synthase
VRDVYDLGDRLLIVTTDRISAFDVVLPTPIPEKGTVLTQLSLFWFDLLKDVVPNHIDHSGRPVPALERHARDLEGRAMVVRRTEPLPVECVVRGYVAGSAWKDYRATGAVCGITLPPGLRESDRLPQPLFTPSTKAEEGHDENISFERMAEIVGAERAEELRALSLELYSRARAHAEARGIILADTKLEFGIDGGRVVWIDEAFTPDSSRFWPKDGYEAGQAQPSFDKQFVRDYLDTLDWGKTAPGPTLPADVLARTADKYREALELLTA